jgi:hypothetical protein
VFFLTGACMLAALVVLEFVRTGRMTRVDGALTGDRG